jgi:hypothetical protein
MGARPANTDGALDDAQGSVSRSFKSIQQAFLWVIPR